MATSTLVDLHNFNVVSSQQSVNNSNKIDGYSGLAESIINDNGIINISSVTLTTAQTSLLQKGLSFCPSPRTLDVGSVVDGLDKFHRSLRLASFFDCIEGPSSDESEHNNGFSHRKFRPATTFNPRGPPTLESFILVNHSQVNKLPHLETHFQNLSKSERLSIRELASNKSIIIKPADKGSGVVIMNTSDYIYEAYRQLSDRNFYKPLNIDKTLHYQNKINHFLTTMRLGNEIDENCYSYLAPSHAKPGRFYLLPKIHKGKLPPPGGPIISVIGSPSEKISEFVDFFLQPQLPDMPSYVRGYGPFPLPH